MSTHLASVEAYDPESDTWSEVADLPTGLRDPAAVSWGTTCGKTRIAAFGGNGGALPHNSVEVYSTGEGC